MRVVEGTGADESGLKAICGNCKQDFDERGGILFEGQGRAGLCPECANEVVALVSDPDSGGHLMGVTAVNLQAFQDFRQLVATSAAGRYLPEIAVRVGAALMKQVADEFRESRDPYGVPWKPVYRWVRGQGRLQGKPLIKTGRLRASVVPRVTGSAVRIALPVEYASYHQFGTRRIPRRQILPDTATGGLGARWTMAVNKEIAAVVEKYLGGRR